MNIPNIWIWKNKKCSKPPTIVLVDNKYWDYISNILLVLYHIVRMFCIYQTYIYIYIYISVSWDDYSQYMEK